MSSARPPAWEWIGSAAPDVRVAGHSHNITLLEAMALIAPADAERVAVLNTRGAATLADDAYWPLAANAGGPTVVVWGGNDHNVHFLLASPPLTVIAPTATDVVVSGTVVPFTMVRAMAGLWLAPLKAWLEEHPDPRSVTLVGTPPPKPEQQIRAGIAIEPYFVDLLAQHGFTPDDAPVTDVASRVATWDAVQAETARIAKDAGAGFLPVPGDVCNPDGTLRVDLCGPDATHANAQYGVILWRHILDHFTS